MNDKVRTESVMIQNLCVPCNCHCRYCLLSWNGKPVGTSWERGKEAGLRLMKEIKEEYPDLDLSFTFGYSMEHPDLKEAINFLKSIGSIQSEYLQCDGLRMRNEQECEELAGLMAEEGVRSLNFTFYGLKEYHDRFAGRNGDFDLMMQMMASAIKSGLNVSAGIPLTKENVATADELINVLKKNGCNRISLFIPHEEGRGATLANVRLEEDDLSLLSNESKQLMNRKIYKTESEWLANEYTEETRRAIIISLRSDNIDRYEKMDGVSLLHEIEELDEQYYSSFPDFTELAALYGNPDSKKLYRIRDLAYHYRKLYTEEYKLIIYDVTDERQSGSRRH